MTESGKKDRREAGDLQCMSNRFIFPRTRGALRDPNLYIPWRSTPIITLKLGASRLRVIIYEGIS